MNTRPAIFGALLVAAAMCSLAAPARVAHSPGGIGDYCSLTVDIAPGNYCWVVCPQGDGPPLSALSPSAGDATLRLTIKDLVGQPVAGIPAADFWVVGCGSPVFLCGGSGAIDATGPTDANGQTTIAGAAAMGSCHECVHVVVQGVIIMGPDCIFPLELPVAVRSPDGDGNGVVDLVDFTRFGGAWEPGGGLYDVCMDFDCNGVVDLIDFTVFGLHWRHLCL